jgi:anti-sigma factor RsiW
MTGSTDEKRWQELNALVDGELPPPRLAEVAAWIAEDRDAARAFATVAAVKTTTARAGTARRRRPPGRTLAAALVLTVGLGGALAVGLWGAGGRDTAALSPRTLGLPDDVTVGGIRLPNLAAGGLRLERAGIVKDGPKSRLEATYVGERGCRVRLVVARAADQPIVATGQAMQWTIGAFVYTLTGDRMDPQRFATVAQIAQADTAAAAATRLAGMPSDLTNRPCLG